MNWLIEVWTNIIVWVLDFDGFLRHRRPLPAAERTHGWWFHGMLVTVAGIFVLGWLLNYFLP